jgi:hypothetical protein
MVKKLPSDRHLEYCFTDPGGTGEDEGIKDAKPCGYLPYGDKAD